MSNNSYLAFICERFNHGRLLVKIQQRDPARWVGPFVTKNKAISNNDLKGDDELLYKELINLDLIDKNLAINDKFITFNQVIERIINHPGLLILDKKLGSAKHASEKDRHEILELYKTSTNIDLGSLISGQIEIYNHSSLKISWIYSKSTIAIPQIENKLKNRNKDKEKSLLIKLSNNTGIPLNLLEEGTVPTFNIEGITKATNNCKNDWVVKSNGESVTFSQDGDWFKKTGLLDKDSLNIIIDAYLNGRNYIQYNSTIRPLTPLGSLSQKEILTLVTTTETNYLIDQILSIKKTFNDAEHKKTKHSLHRKGFNGELKKYQYDGVLWINELFIKKTGGILADEMGLGKTVQILAYVLFSKKIKTLIICPSSLIPNWESEISKFIKNINIYKSIEYNDTFRKNQSITIVSYQYITKNHSNINEVYDLLVLDEGQFAKNKETKIARSIRQIKSNMRIVVTGTPIENSVHDLWSHLTFVSPSLEKIYHKLISDFPGFSKSKLAAEFSIKAFQSIILRRTKKSVKLDIKDLVEEVVYCDMYNDQRALYETISEVFLELINRGVSARINSIALEGILRLRQVCSSPKLLPNNMNNKNASRSIKIDKTIEIIKNESQHKKVIIFSQFKGVLDEIRSILDSLGIGFSILTGETHDRLTPVNDFQKNDLVRVFLIGFKAGGVGLNLTQAERIILFDPWWNPAAESQAFARAHRIGQEKTVKVTKLICKDTIEEKMLAILKNKIELTDTLESNIKEFSKKELIDLLSK